MINGKILIDKDLLSMGGIVSELISKPFKLLFLGFLYEVSWA
jgi:hypothetical protein